MSLFNDFCDKIQAILAKDHVISQKAMEKILGEHYKSFKDKLKSAFWKIGDRYYTKKLTDEKLTSARNMLLEIMILRNNDNNNEYDDNNNDDAD